MPTQATIAITPGSGQFLDAVSLVIGATTVVRETVVLADPSNATYLATVTSAGALNVTDSILDGCITANVLAVSLPAGQITTLTPPTAAAIGTAVSTDLLIGTQFAAASVPVALPTATITTLTPPTAAAIAAAIVANPPAVTFSAPQHVIVDSGTLTTVSTVTAVTSITNPVAVTGTFFQATQPVSIASGQVASGAFASGSIASGAIASGAIASGAIAAGAAAAGAFADGSVFVRSNAASTFPVTAIGTLTNNNAAPAGTNVGALTAIANAAAPSFSEGDQVLVSVDLSGHQRVVATGPAAAGAAASGNPVLVGGIDASGNIRQLPVANAGVGTLPTQTLIIGGKNYDSNGVIQAGFDGFGTISTINSVANGDAQSNTTGFLYASAQDTNRALAVYPAIFNGTTWDRARSAGVGNAVAATGIAAHAAYGEYLTAAPANTTGKYSALQTDDSGSLFTKNTRRSQTAAQGTTISSTTAATAVTATPAAATFADLSQLIITVGAIATTAIAFTATLSDGTNTYIYDMDTGVIASGGADPLIINFNPPLPATSAATGWTIALSVNTVVAHITTVVVLQKAS